MRPLPLAGCYGYARNAWLKRRKKEQAKWTDKPGPKHGRGERRGDFLLHLANKRVFRRLALTRQVARRRVQA